MARSAAADRYPQLVLITIKDPAKFARYVELVTPIVEPYGGRLDRQFSPTALYGDGVEKPDVVNLVSSPSRELFDAFQREPKFRDVVHLRSESIVMVEAHGPVVRRGHALSGDPAERLYILEIAKFGAGGERAYRAYEKESESVMRRYGYDVELELAPHASNGLPFVPDLVKVAYFDAKDGMDRMHADPAHDRIEKELYPRAVAASIWVIAALSERSPR